MTISELIERLEAIKAEHGDLPVKCVDRWTVGEPKPKLAPWDEPKGVWI